MSGQGTGRVFAATHFGVPAISEGFRFLDDPSRERAQQHLVVRLTARQMISWTAYVGLRIPTLPQTLDEPLTAYDDPDDEAARQTRAWVLITPTGQHLG